MAALHARARSGRSRAALRNNKHRRLHGDRLRDLPGAEECRVSGRARLFEDTRAAGTFGLPRRPRVALCRH